MYRKVLVPLDESKEAEKVLPIVQSVLAPEGEVTLLHVIPPSQTQMMVVGEHHILGTELEEAERSKALSYLKFVVHQLGVNPEQWHCQVEVSKAVAKAIVDLAIREEVDLIAMYTHDRKGLAKLIKGSIAEKVQKKAPIEVQVFKPQELGEPVTAAVSADDT